MQRLTRIPLHSAKVTEGIGLPTNTRGLSLRLCKN